MNPHLQDFRDTVQYMHYYSWKFMIIAHSCTVFLYIKANITAAVVLWQRLCNIKMGRKMRPLRVFLLAFPISLAHLSFVFLICFVLPLTIRRPKSKCRPCNNSSEKLEKASRNMINRGVGNLCRWRLLNSKTSTNLCRICALIVRLTTCSIMYSVLA